MLRLLQKRHNKICRTQADHAGNRYLLFAIGLHGMVLALLWVPQQGPALLLNVRSFHTLPHAKISWLSVQKHSASGACGTTATLAFTKPAAARASKVTVPRGNRPKPTALKQKVRATHEAPVTTPTVHKKELCSPVDLGPRKRERHHQPIQEQQPPVNDQITQVVEQAGTPLALSLHEYQEYQEMQEIVNAVRRWWYPPRGVQPQALCTVRVTIASSGSVTAAVIEKSSGVPVYDIAAKGALLKATFPKHIWGKQCVVQF